MKQNLNMATNRYLNYKYAMNDYSQLRKPKIQHDSTFYENGALRYDFMTSLQNIAMAKIGIILWMNQKTKLEKKIVDKWHIIEKYVLNLLSELLLPKTLTKRLENVVPIIGDSILHWIGYNDRYIFKSDSSVDHINNLAWTARGNVDYAQTARNILANPYSSLSSKKKYELACAYCLEEEIGALAPNVLNRFYLNGINIDTDTMVGFWTAHLKGDNRILVSTYYSACERPRRKQIVSGMSINEKIIESLLRNYTVCNEVAIAHMWDELTEEEKAKNLVSLLQNLGNQDLRYSILSSLDYEQQQKVLKRCSDVILGDMFNDWLWGEYFVPTALQALPVMDQLSYSDILNMIIKEMNSSHEEGNTRIYDRYKYVFKQLWHNSPWYLKDFFIQHKDGYFVQRLLIPSLSRNKDIIALILNDLNSLQKRNIIFRNDGILHCAAFILRGRWDLLQLFIEHTLTFEDEIKYLKQTLMIERGQIIASKFYMHKAVDKIEKFLRWGFKSEYRINDFKRSLASFDTLLKWIIDKNNADYRKIRNLFKWCSNGDQEQMDRFKMKFPTTISGKYLILKFIGDDNYKMLDKFLNWCFLKNQRHIMTFKSNLYKDKMYFTAKLACILSKKKKSFKKLSKFIDWSLTNREGIQKLTAMFLSNEVQKLKLIFLSGEYTAPLKLDKRYHLENSHLEKSILDTAFLF